MSSSFEIYLNALFKRSNPNHDIQMATSPSLGAHYRGNPILGTPYPTSLTSPPPYTNLQSIGVPYINSRPLTVPYTTTLTPVPSPHPYSKRSFGYRNGDRSKPYRLELPTTKLEVQPETPALPTPLLTPVPMLSSTLNTTTPPTTPGAISPPQFFFPPDFPLPNKADQQNLRTPSPTPAIQNQILTPPGTPAQTPSSFGKTPKQKRRRTKFTTFQLDVLEREFDDCNYISTERRQSLAAVLGLTSENIRVWFQNRRTQIKRMENNRPKHF